MSGLKLQLPRGFEGDTEIVLRYLREAEKSGAVIGYEGDGEIVTAVTLSRTSAGYVALNGLPEINGMQKKTYIDSERDKDGNFLICTLQFPKSRPGIDIAPSSGIMSDGAEEELDDEYLPTCCRNGRPHSHSV